MTALSFQKKAIRWAGIVIATCGLAVFADWSFSAPGLAQDAQMAGPGNDIALEPGAIRATGQAGVLNPDSQSALNGPAAALSPADIEDLLKRKRQLQQDTAKRNQIHLPSPAGLPAVVGEGTTLVTDDDSKFPTTPDALVIKRNNLNPATVSQSTLAEPAAANNGAQVLATGNFSHWEFSNNGGATWSKFVFGNAPADAPSNCCDNDVIHDRGRGVTFMSTLYINSSLTHGDVRIFVFRNMTGASCSYTINPGASILPDYPHIGKSNNFLYLTLNNIGPGGQAQIRRFNIDNMADCVGAAFTTVNLNDRATVGQRVVTPAEGAERTMYFSWAENSTQIRIFSWPESAAAPTSVLRTISASSFTNPDCRGGALNNDFTDSLWSDITGFNRRGAVGKGLAYFYWNVGPDASHTQGHVHSAIFNEAGLTLAAQTPMFISGNAACNGLAHISTNDRGDLGISTAVGGKAGGGGSAAQGFVGIADDFSGGVGFFPTIALTAAGTHNRTDQRYGDYFVTHRHNPCGNSWTATNYALNGGTAVNNVNSRYIEFGRGRDRGCQDEYVNSIPIAQ